MSPKRMRPRPALEALEGRLAMSSGFAANTIAVVPGDVRAPGSVDHVEVPVAAENLARRHSTVVAVFVRPAPGSALLPAIDAVRGPDGQELPLRQGVQFQRGGAGMTTALVDDATPGRLTVEVSGRKGSAGAFTLQATLPGDVNGDGQVQLNDLNAYPQSFNSSFGAASYNPAVDANQNGFIGHGDGKLLVRNLTPLTPKVPLTIDLALAPGDQARGPNPKNSGGITNKHVVTILGHTTPGSVVFSDSGLGDYKFNGSAIATDASGNFAQTVTLTGGLTNFEYLAIDPYGQQTIRAFPVFWKLFAAPGSQLK